jgi:hypothetical protein
MSVLDDIREDFPFLAYLVNDPEVGKLLREAVDPNAGFSPQRFQAKLMTTKWYKSQSEQQRAWQAKIHTDPGTATQDRNAYYAQLRQVASQLGVKLNANEIRFISELNLGRGIAANDPQTLMTLTQLRNKPGHADVGSIKTNAKRVGMLAKSQYFMGLSDRDAKNWGQSIAMGTKTEDDFQAWISERAASKFPWLAKRIKAGETMQSMFSGHIQTIAEELEIAPEMIDISTGRWSSVMGRVDPKTNTTRPLSLYETKILARQDPRFWKTQHGQAEDAQMATMMAQTFGKRA